MFGMNLKRQSGWTLGKINDDDDDELQIKVFEYHIFSNFSKNNKNWDDSKRKIPGFFKSEVTDKDGILMEFAGLRSKGYDVFQNNITIKFIIVIIISVLNCSL